MRFPLLVFAGLLMLSDTSTGQWAQIYSSTKPLTDLLTLPSGRVLATGMFETFLVSDDAGLTWLPHQIHSCEACYFNYDGLRIIDDTVFVYGRQYGANEENFAYKTSNSGDSWIKEEDRLFVEHLDGDVVSRKVAFDSLLVRYQGYGTYYLFRTLDGWKTQKVIDSTDAGQGRIMYRFDFKDSTTGLLATSFTAEPGAYLERTRDAGRTWEWCEGRPKWTLGLKWLGGSVWLAADFNLRDAAAVRRSTDDGANWKPVAVNAPIPSGFYTDASSESILAPALVDSWNVDFEGKYLVSSDRGLTWHLKRMMDSLRPVRKMAFVTSQIQLAIVDDTTIIRTTNAGGPAESLAVESGQVDQVPNSTIALRRGEPINLTHQGIKYLKIYNSFGGLIYYLPQVPEHVETSSLIQGLYFLDHGGMVQKLLIK